MSIKTNMFQKNKIEICFLLEKKKLILKINSYSKALEVVQTLFTFSSIYFKKKNCASI